MSSVKDLLNAYLAIEGIIDSNLVTEDTRTNGRDALRQLDTEIIEAVKPPHNENEQSRARG